MINAVTRSSSHELWTTQQQTRQPDALTAKRSAESRQLAIAAINQQQKEKVQQAVAAYMSLSVGPLSDRAHGATPLSQAQSAYAEF